MGVDKAVKVVYSMIKIKKKTVESLKEENFSEINKDLAKRFITALETDLKNLEKIKRELLELLPGPPSTLKKTNR